ncbi:hypothetical protein [Chloroflexus sp.]|uniref:hypothetical protein n=1 Tax=Chloroflexus sp. TaxID=1904827 RepID=UPI002ACEECAB|nr:hypothetical protein [Chloroflexus sp.]
MYPSLAQIITLTAWVNAALHAPTAVNPGEVYPENPAFRSCEVVRFVNLNHAGAVGKETLYAADPIAWLARLREEGVTALRLVYDPAPTAAAGSPPVGFGDDGSCWLIEAVKLAASDYWEARWELGDRFRADGRRWQVTSGRIVANAPAGYATSSATVAEVTQQIIAHLPKMIDFALDHYADQFARSFAIALHFLTTPASPPDEDDRLPPASGQLLAAVRAAWVCGGMGSWTDMSFAGEVQAEYDALTDELYSLLQTAIVAAVNR